MPKSLILTHQSFSGGVSTTRRFFVPELAGAGVAGREISVHERGGAITHRWLQVAVNEVVLVHEAEALGHLRCDSASFELRELLAEEALQVSVRKVFHSDEDHIHGLVPTKTLDEVRVILKHGCER